VIGDRVRIGDGAVLERAIVWNDAMIGARAVVRDTIVGERYAVDDGVTLERAIVANEPAPT
jgi:NDP-sugar pyrophosphorylase family protein